MTVLSLALPSLATRLIPPSVAVLTALAISPLCDWKVACWSASSFPLIPMCARTQLIPRPVSSLNASLLRRASLISCSIEDLGGAPLARLIAVDYVVLKRHSYAHIFI